MNRIAVIGVALAALALSGCGNAAENADPSSYWCSTHAEDVFGWQWVAKCDPERAAAEIAESKAKTERDAQKFADRLMDKDEEENPYGIDVRDGGDLYIDGEYVGPPGSEWEYDGGSSGGGGGCVWSPTYNGDWHDDYVCGGERQYFLPGDDFIEQWEIDAAAQEWEASRI